MLLNRVRRRNIRGRDISARTIRYQVMRIEFDIAVCARITYIQRRLLLLTFKKYHEHFGFARKRGKKILRYSTTCTLSTTAFPIKHNMYSFYQHGRQQLRSKFYRFAYPHSAVAAQPVVLKLEISLLIYPVVYSRRWFVGISPVFPRIPGCSPSARGMRTRWSGHRLTMYIGDLRQSGLPRRTLGERVIWKKAERLVRDAS